MLCSRTVNSRTILSTRRPAWKKEHMKTSPCQVIQGGNIASYIWSSVRQQGRKKFRICLFCYLFPDGKQKGRKAWESSHEGVKNSVWCFVICHVFDYVIRTLRKLRPLIWLVANRPMNLGFLKQAWRYMKRVCSGNHSQEGPDESRHHDTQTLERKPGLAQDAMSVLRMSLHYVSEAYWFRRSQMETNVAPGCFIPRYLVFL